MKTSTWRTVGGMLSAFFFFDTISYLVTGKGLAGLIVDGDGNPLVIAIAQHIAPIPGWMFYIVCLLAVVLLAAIMCACVTSSRKGYL